MSTGTCGRQERLLLDCLKLELKMVVSSLAGVMGTKLWSSVRAEGTSSATVLASLHWDRTVRAEACGIYVLL